jgi:hypothetical protein
MVALAVTAILTPRKLANGRGVNLCFSGSRLSNEAILSQRATAWEIAW